MTSTKSVWLAAATSLKARSLLDLPHSHSLSNLSTAQLIAEVKRSVVGPRTWSSQRPVVRHAVTLKPDDIPWRGYVLEVDQLDTATWESVRIFQHRFNSLAYGHKLLFLSWPTIYAQFLAITMRVKEYWVVLLVDSSAGKHVIADASRYIYPLEGVALVANHLILFTQTYGQGPRLICYDVASFAPFWVPFVASTIDETHSALNMIIPVLSPDLIGDDPTYHTYFRDSYVHTQLSVQESVLHSGSHILSLYMRDPLAVPKPAAPRTLLAQLWRARRGGPSLPPPHRAALFRYRFSITPEGPRLALLSVTRAARVHAIGRISHSGHALTAGGAYPIPGGAGGDSHHVNAAQDGSANREGIETPAGPLLNMKMRDDGVHRSLSPFSGALTTLEHDGVLIEYYD
ncbi:hypothetical protein B0H19DRAFT_1274069 [Mycena capillaripes]|nr:hypothetical protein B0H19DRAFT_1274069 [Mycena capillaripes]